MIFFRFISLSLFFSMILISAPALADVVHLTNGTAIAGDVLGANPLMKVQIKTERGIQYIAWDDIVRIEGSSNSLSQAALQGASAAKKPKISPLPTATSPEPQAQLDTPDPDAGFLGAKWSGRANAGARIQSGNTEKTTLNVDASTKAKWGKDHRASVKLEYNREKDEGTLTVDNKSADLAYDYFYSPQWFLNSTVGFEQDEINSIDMRTTVGGGLGYQAYEQDDLNLQFILGVSYLNEEFTTSAPSEDSLAYKWSSDYDQKFWDDALQLFHNHEILVPSDDTEDFLFESKSGVRVPLAKILTATAEVDFDWDNKPAAGKREEDTTYSFKLGYEW